ncbi:MAG: hypothetical protein IJ654_08525 [Bacteroidales bacterium]|nr:hypothetical protein [Bacteroidales bacterium]
MKKTLFATLAFSALASVSALAQTFNPRVEVENTYEGKIVEAGKNVLPMNVPDSVYKFQYQLDYSVFDNPFRGSYQFKPYKIEMRPDAAPSEARKLFVSLGAGWSLHPEADVVWSPAFRTLPVKMSVYDRFRGFLGHYGLMPWQDDFTILSHPTRPLSGYVLDNKVGANVRYEFPKLALEVDGGYRSFWSQDTLSRHFLQRAEVEARLLPLDPNKADYFYGGRIYVKAGQDRLYSLMSDRHKLGVNDMGADLLFGVPLGARSRVLLDLGVESEVYSGVQEMSATRLWATPHYEIRWNGGSADLGVKVSFLKGSDNTDHYKSYIRLNSKAFLHKSDIIYPAVQVKQFLVPGHLAVYARAVGGDCLNDYVDLLVSNPFTDPLAVSDNLDSSSERINACVGLEGDIAGRLQIDLHGGYAVRHNWRVDCVEFVDRFYNAPSEGWKGHYLSSYYNYCDFNEWYADLSFLWKSPRLDIDGHFRFQDTDLIPRAYYGVAPSRFSGELEATFNWNRQAFAGITLGAASRRNGLAYISASSEFRIDAPVQVPGWVDLGLHGRYVINPRWTVWAKAGNLLGQSVQRYFLHPEKGPYGTVGITFKL